MVTTETTTVNIKRFYNAINSAWKYVKAHEQIGTTSESFAKYKAEIDEICKDLGDVEQAIYAAAYKLLVESALDKIETINVNANRKEDDDTDFR